MLFGASHHSLLKAPPTWEPAANIHDEILTDYQESVRREAEADAAAEAELADDSDDESDESDVGDDEDSSDDEDALIGTR